MIDVKESLTHHIGPLPAYAWGVVVIGGYLGFRALSGGRGGGQTLGGASAPLADLGASGGGSGGLGDGIDTTPLHDIGVPGTYTGDPINAYQTATYAYINGLGNNPGTYAEWVQNVINESGGTLIHTPVPTTPANPPPVTTPPPATTPAGTTPAGTTSRLVTFKTLAGSAVNYLKTTDAPLSLHQLHLLHLRQPVQLSTHQAHLLHVWTGR